MSTPITDALSVKYPDAPMTIFREMEKLELENERRRELLEEWQQDIKRMIAKIHLEGSARNIAIDKLARIDAELNNV